MQKNKSWRLRSTVLNLDQPVVMGILNLTPDSFSDGGQFKEPKMDDFKVDLKAFEGGASHLIHSGAGILDVGGESTRPGADPVGEEEELSRVIPAVRALVKRFDVPISVDTYRPAVAAAALEEGASIINDVAAGRYDSKEKRIVVDRPVETEEMAEVVARYGAAVVLGHMCGVPKTMQENLVERGDRVVDEVFDFLVQRRDAFVKAGVDPARIAYDPGIGFGKTLKENWTLMRETKRFAELGPIVVGHSRKSLIKDVANRRYARLNDPDGAPSLIGLDFLTAQLSAMLAYRGVDVLRVHNVAATDLALELMRTEKEMR